MEKKSRRAEWELEESDGWRPAINNPRQEKRKKKNRNQNGVESKLRVLTHEVAGCLTPEDGHYRSKMRRRRNIKKKKKKIPPSQSSRLERYKGSPHYIYIAIIILGYIYVGLCVYRAGGRTLTGYILLLLYFFPTILCVVQHPIAFLDFFFFRLIVNIYICSRYQR